MNQMRHKFVGGGGGGRGRFREPMNQMRHKFGGLGSHRNFRMRKQMNRGTSGGSDGANNGGELGSDDTGAQSLWDWRARRLDVWAQAFGGASADGVQGNEDNNNQQDNTNKNNL